MLDYQSVTFLICARSLEIFRDLARQMSYGSDVVVPADDAAGGYGSRLPHRLGIHLQSS